MARSVSIDDVLLDLKSLVGEARTRRLRQLGVAALKKGQSPVLSLTAAVSASLVSAAAKEEEIDALAGLVAVDDLSAFGEDCLPGSNYASGEVHDHDSTFSGDAHADHFGRASYLADPFASKFENAYAREHQGHGDHEEMTAHHASHGGVNHQHHTASVGAAHSGQHANHPMASAEHQHGAARHTSQQHQIAGHDGVGHDSAGHEPHEAGHDMHAAQGPTGHGGAHNAHASHANHGAQAVSADGKSHVDHAQGESLVEGETIDLNQSISALAQSHDAEHDSHAGDAPVTETTDEHAHHHPTLAELDTPAVDDLAATQALPII